MHRRTSITEGALRPVATALVAAALATVVLACGAGAGDAEADHAAADPPPPVEAAPPPPSLSSPGPPIESAYVLARVDGEELPVTLAERAGCEVRLVSGMVILEDGRFELRHTTEDHCDGRPPRDATHRARGLAARDGDVVRLDADQGTAFAAASGSYRDGVLRLESVTTPAGDEPVDWTYDRVAPRSRR